MKAQIAYVDPRGNLTIVFEPTGPEGLFWPTFEARLKAIIPTLQSVQDLIARERKQRTFEQKAHANNARRETLTMLRSDAINTGDFEKLNAIDQETATLPEFIDPKTIIATQSVCNDLMNAADKEVAAKAKELIREFRADIERRRAALLERLTTAPDAATIEELAVVCHGFEQTIDRGKIWPQGEPVAPFADVGCAGRLLRDHIAAQKMPALTLPPPVGHFPNQPGYQPPAPGSLVHLAAQSPDRVLHATHFGHTPEQPGVRAHHVIGGR